MKFYRTDNLFIAHVGYTYGTRKNGDRYNHFESNGFGLFKKHPYSSHEYIDIFSKVEYKNFHSIYCNAGDEAVNQPTELILFIQKNYDDLKKLSSKIQTIAYKIVSGKLVDETELKELLFALNNNNELEKPNTKSNSKIKIYTDLYKKKYTFQPCIGRDNQIKDLTVLIAAKENPILVGDHGTGKTTIVEGLVYNIQKNKVPPFLKKQKIIELDTPNLIACKECAEEKLIELIALCIKKNIILFIDDIDKLIDLKLDSIITESINRKNLKVIATTTLENYNKYFFNSNFTKLYIDEPGYEDLANITRHKIGNLCLTTNILMLNDMDSIIDLLIELTKITNRKINTNNKIEDDKSANPYLVIQIIDRMFAQAISNNQTKLSIENIIYAINACDKIEDEAKEKCISNIKNLYSDENNKQLLKK